MKIYREIGSIHLVLQCDKEGYFRPVYEIEVDEAEPIRHGHWVKNDEYSDEIEEHIVYECSECGELYDWFDVPEHKYCRHCGAKMDEEK